MKTYNLGIVIPTYNESENIQSLLTSISEYIDASGIKTLLLVMDDSSPDGTAAIVEQYIAQNTSKHLNVEIQQRPGKMGLASAYKEGFRRILPQCEYVQSMDADHSHHPKYLQDLYAKAQEGYDLVIGSRGVPGGSVVGWGPFRRFVSSMGSLYSSVILLTPIKDFTGGFNLYNAEIFEKLKLEDVQAEGYLFQIEMKYKTRKLGFKFAEVPIVFKDRTHGKSKFSKNIIFEALFGVILLPFKS